MIKNIFKSVFSYFVVLFAISQLSFTMADPISPEYTYNSDINSALNRQEVTLMQATDWDLLWTFNRGTTPVDLSDADDIKFIYTDKRRTWSVTVEGELYSDGTDGKIKIHFLPENLNTNSLKQTFDYVIEVKNATEVLGYATGYLNILENVNTGAGELTIDANLDWSNYTNYLNQVDNGPYKAGTGITFTEDAADGNRIEISASQFDCQYLLNSTDGISTNLTVYNHLNLKGDSASPDIVFNVQQYQNVLKPNDLADQNLEFTLPDHTGTLATDLDIKNATNNLNADILARDYATVTRVVAATNDLNNDILARGYLTETAADLEGKVDVNNGVATNLSVEGIVLKQDDMSIVPEVTTGEIVIGDDTKGAKVQINGDDNANGGEIILKMGANAGLGVVVKSDADDIHMAVSSVDGGLNTKNISPLADNTYDIGSESYHVKDIYVAGKVIPAYEGDFVINNVVDDLFKVSSVDGTVTTRDIIPETDNTYSLGSPTHQFKDVYVGPDSLYIGGTPFSETTLTNLTNNVQTLLDGGGSLPEGIVTNNYDGNFNVKGKISVSNAAPYSTFSCGANVGSSLALYEGAVGANRYGFAMNGSPNRLTTYANGSEVMSINSSGNVGIGTTNISEKLDVAGNIKATGSLIITNASNTGVDFYKGAEINCNDGSLEITSANNRQTQISSGGGNPLIFKNGTQNLLRKGVFDFLDYPTTDPTGQRYTMVLAQKNAAGNTNSDFMAFFNNATESFGQFNGGDKVLDINYKGDIYTVGSLSILNGEVPVTSSTTNNGGVSINPSLGTCIAITMDGDMSISISPFITNAVYDLRVAVNPSTYTLSFDPATVDASSSSSIIIAPSTWGDLYFTKGYGQTTFKVRQ